MTGSPIESAARDDVVVPAARKLPATVFAKSMPTGSVLIVMPLGRTSWVLIPRN